MVAKVAISATFYPLPVSSNRAFHNLSNSRVTSSTEVVPSQIFGSNSRAIPLKETPSQLWE